MGFHTFILLGSFALLVYDPRLILVSNKAEANYQEFTSYLGSLNAPVYAPWIGQLQDGQGPATPRQRPEHPACSGGRQFPLNGMRLAPGEAELN